MTEKLTGVVESSENAKKTVFVGMSGGVDSSVSALLLVRAGYHVVGVYMKNWSEDLPGMKCPWAEDLADAKRVAVRLGIEFEVWDFEKEYRERVVEYMIAEFRKGNTPNPDVMCNEEIKFRLFYERAVARGADFIATGHYARVSSDGRLLRAVDENKDQTYFLYRISKEATERTLFPIGGILKPEVKKLAAEAGLHNAYKKESMGVCFVGEVGMKDFLKEYIEAAPGETREVGSERVLGYHDGAVFYTIGQRHGLYISGVSGEVNDGMPYYVVAKDLGRNIVYVSKDLNFAGIWVRELWITDLVLRDGVSGEELASRDLTVRLRHRAELIPVEIEFRDFRDGGAVESSENYEAVLKFEHEIKRPAAGQSAVLYDGEVCVGGGIIAA